MTQFDVFVLIEKRNFTEWLCKKCARKNTLSNLDWLVRFLMSVLFLQDTRARCQNVNWASSNGGAAKCSKCNSTAIDPNHIVSAVFAHGHDWQQRSRHNWNQIGRNSNHTGLRNRSNHPKCSARDLHHSRGLYNSNQCCLHTKQCSLIQHVSNNISDSLGVSIQIIRARRLCAHCAGL